MTDKRILFVSQEVAPYLSYTPLSAFGKDLPTALHRKGYEIRIFMPKYGLVNERRNQLHEVIRLSGVNIIIDDNDHPLIIKVASLQPSRIQVYFIDNDDYFQKLASDEDPFGSNRSDNDERSIFFARGILETAKKLRWDTSVIHCAGVASALVPLYFRTSYADDVTLADAKVVYSVTDESLTVPVDPRIFDKLAADGINPEVLERLRNREFGVIPIEDEEEATAEETPVSEAETSGADAGETPAVEAGTSGEEGAEEAEEEKPVPDRAATNLMHALAIAGADGVIFQTEKPDPELLRFVEELGKPYIIHPLAPVNADDYIGFYNSLRNNPTREEV